MYNRFYLKKKPRKTPVLNIREKEFTFLKNLRVVRYYIQKRYELSSAELDMMLYLYDESVFDKKMFNSYAESMMWDKDRFKDMNDRGLIKVWRKTSRTNHRELYELSHKAKLICSHTYKKLLGLELISEDPYRNKIMKGENYMDKIYRNLIKKMNSRTTTDAHNEE